MVDFDIGCVVLANEPIGAVGDEAIGAQNFPGLSNQPGISGGVCLYHMLSHFTALVILYLDASMPQTFLFCIQGLLECVEPVAIKTEDSTIPYLLQQSAHGGLRRIATYPDLAVIAVFTVQILQRKALATLLIAERDDEFYEALSLAHGASQVSR